MQSTKLRVGSKIVIDNEPYIVLEFTQRQKQRGAARIITKLKNLLSHAIIEHTFFSGEELKEADISYVNSSYLYQSGDDFVFMNTEDYEQFEVSATLLGTDKNYLIDDLEVTMMKYGEQVIGIQLPPSIVLAVVETTPGVRGDTVSGGTKPATTVTGLVVKVPLFVNVGDRILVNTKTGVYKERAK